MHRLLPAQTLSVPQRRLLALETRKNAALSDLLEVVQETFDAVWDDPVAMFAAQGVQGETNIEQHALAVTFLIQAGVNVPERYRTALQPYTIQPDGTVIPQ